MSYLKKYINRFKSQTSNNDIVAGVVGNMYLELPEIRKWIKERWLIGEKPDGSIIGFYSSGFYAEMKRRDNPLASGTVDLTDTGRMGDLLDIDAQGVKFEFFSTVEYFDNIVQKYGAYNFNITDEQKGQLLLKIENKVLFDIMNKVWEAA